MFIQNKGDNDKEKEFLDEYLYVMKLLVVGEAGVGKTSLIRRYVDQIWDPRTLKTIGVDFSLKNIDVPLGDSNVRVKLQIWDFCGEKRYQQLLPIYSQGTHGVFFCFDLSRQGTFEKLKDWEKVLASTLTRPVVPMVLGLKSDLVSNVELESLQQQVHRYLGVKNVLYCSAKTGENVENAFSEMARLMYNRHFRK